MKKVFLLFAILVFINARSQVKDSTEIIRQRLGNESVFGNDVAGIALPGFTAKDLNGKLYEANSFRNGNVTFVNLWFVACPPCIEEIPTLNRLYEMMKDSAGFQFFAITWESETKAREAIEKYDMRFPVLLVSPKDAIQLTFGKGYPTNMLVDKQGKIGFIFSGGLSAGAEFYWKQEIKKLVKGHSLNDVRESVHISGNSPDIVFIESLSEFKTFDALTDYFKGQSLFIDLWASWCLECRLHFRSKNSVDSFLDKHKIARLFISADNLKAKETWKDLIYKYQLKGYHLLAGEELVKDIKQRVHAHKATDSHRYIIVQNGKIVESKTFQSVSDQQLIKQLTEKLF